MGDVRDPSDAVTRQKGKKARKESSDGPSGEGQPKPREKTSTKRKQDESSTGGGGGGGKRPRRNDKKEPGDRIVSSDEGEEEDKEKDEEEENHEENSDELSLQLPNSFVFKTANPKRVTNYRKTVKKQRYPDSKLILARRPEGERGKKATSITENKKKSKTKSSNKQPTNNEEANIRQESDEEEEEEEEGAEETGEDGELPAEETEAAEETGEDGEVPAEETGEDGEVPAEETEGAEEKEGAEEAEEEAGKEGETREKTTKKRTDIFRTPTALIKKRQEVMRMTKNKEMSRLLEYFIAETEETKRRQEKLAQELKNIARDQKGIDDNLSRATDEIKQSISQSRYKPNLSEVQKAEEKAKLPWKKTSDMIYALKYHQKAIKTFILGTVPQNLPKWEVSVAKAIMTKEMLARQIYSGPASRCVGRESQIKMGIRCYKQPNELASFITVMIRDNDFIKDKKHSLRTWRRVFELTLKNMRIRETYKLAGSAINESESARGQVAGTLILNDLIKNAGGITEPAPDLTSEEEMSSWLMRYKEHVINKAIKVSGWDEDRDEGTTPTLLELIKKNLSKGMSLEGLLKNHARILAGEELEVEEREEREDSNSESED